MRNGRYKALLLEGATTKSNESKITRLHKRSEKLNMFADRHVMVCATAFESCLPWCELRSPSAKVLD